MATTKLYKVEAIVLKRKNVGETDRVLTIFSKEYGKLRVLGKGIRRITSRRAPHLEIFSHVRLLLHQGKTWDSISEVQPVHTFAHIRQDLKKVGAAYYLCELVDTFLPERQEHADVFWLLRNTLADVNRGVHGQVVFAFAQTLLHTLGFLPKERILREEELPLFIERIAEKRLKTPKIIAQLAG